MLRNTLRAKLTGILAVGLITLTGAIATAALVQQHVRGRMTAADTESNAKAKFKLDIRQRGDRQKERLSVDAKNMDTTLDDEENLPVYDVILIDADDNEADFGALTLRSSGRARLRFHSARDEFPTDVDSLEDFGGGTIEIRDGATVVMSEDIPAFVDPDGDNESGSGSGARTKGKSKLSAVAEDGRGKGTIRVRAWNRPNNTGEKIALTVRKLDRADGPYKLFVIDGATETELGQFRTYTRLGFGILRIDTRDGDEIGDDDSVFDLSGLDLEVRDAAGDAVLSGKFPTL